MANLLASIVSQQSTPHIILRCGSSTVVQMDIHRRACFRSERPRGRWWISIATFLPSSIKYRDLTPLPRLHLTFHEEVSHLVACDEPCAGRIPEHYRDGLLVHPLVGTRAGRCVFLKSLHHAPSGNLTIHPTCCQQLCVAELVDVRVGERNETISMRYIRTSFCLVNVCVVE